MKSALVNHNVIVKSKKFVQFRRIPSSSLLLPQFQAPPPPIRISRAYKSFSFPSLTFHLRLLLIYNKPSPSRSSVSWLGEKREDWQHSGMLIAGRSPCIAALLLLFLSAAIQSVPATAVKPMPQSMSESLILKDSIVKMINANPAAGWKAGMNPRFSNYTVQQFKYILGVKQTPHNALINIPVKTYPKSLSLPKEFDARTSWSHCTSIGRILDQGHCGSCWAFGAVEALSDRFCIHFGINASLSANDLLACCGFMCGDGCDGGYPIFAWQYFVQNGVVTEECDPYFDQIGCAHPGCEPSYPTPRCEKQCKVKNKVWAQNKHFAVNAYKINSDPQNIMAEVYQNGPVEVAFSVYEDFAHYKSGVYKHITGDEMGGHAVKLIGWGTSEQGEDYWLLANQWNRGWGDDGYFKILRGANECGIEADVVAGLPSAKNLIRNFADMDSGADAAA